MYSSCIKDTPTPNHEVTCKGRVLENGTKKPIPFATVYLYFFKGGDIWGGNTESYLIEKFTADKDGNYQLKYMYETGKGYELRAGAERYYLSAPTVIYDDKGAFSTDILVDPYAWIKFHVVNTNPFDENDNIGINNSCVGSLIGERIDTTYICKKIGNNDIEIIWGVIKAGEKKLFRDTIPYLKAHDTTFFEIRY